MTINDIIGKGLLFEPPFHCRGKNVKDKNLRTLVQVKAYDTLQFFEDINLRDGVRTIADHICDLLNREHVKQNPD